MTNNTIPKINQPNALVLISEEEIGSDLGSFNASTNSLAFNTFAIATPATTIAKSISSNFIFKSLSNSLNIN